MFFLDHHQEYELKGIFEHLGISLNKPAQDADHWARASYFMRALALLHGFRFISSGCPWLHAGNGERVVAYHGFHEDQYQSPSWVCWTRGGAIRKIAERDIIHFLQGHVSGYEYQSWPMESPPVRNEYFPWDVHG